LKEHLTCLGITPPPQQQNASVAGEMGAGSTTTATTLTGDIGTGVASTVDPITEIARSLLQSLLALF
jgi:hypothetical protein